MSFYDVGAYHSSPVLGKRPFKPSFDVPSGKVLYVSPTGTGTATMTTSTGTHINNNWQLPDAVEFISTTPGTAGFLVPKRGAYV